MELFVLEGSLEDISSFVGQVRATRDTLTVDYSVIPVDEFPAAPGDAHGDGEEGSGHATHGDRDEETGHEGEQTGDGDGGAAETPEE
jgi:CopG family nickel-responsive transcriptional regulator